MQAIIGNRLLPALKPQESPYEVRDTKLKGFILRVQPSGTMSYIVEYGRGKRITLGKVGVLIPTQARDRAVEVLADVTKGADPMAVKKAAKAHDFKAYINYEYAPWVEAHRKSGHCTVAMLKACFFTELGDKKLIEITPWIVEKWRAARLKDGIHPATVNRNLVALKACLSKAVEWNLLESHPLAKTKPSKVDQAPKVRFLDHDEEKRLRAALDTGEEHTRQERDNANQWRRSRGYDLLPDLRTVAFTDHLKPLVLISINTGLRRGELFSLTWNHVDLGRSLLTITGDSTKSGKTRHIPLNAEALQVLTGWKAQAADITGLVFPAKDGGRLDNVKSAWSSLLKSAGIVNFRWHAIILRPG